MNISAELVPHHPCHLAVECISRDLFGDGLPYGCQATIDHSDVWDWYWSPVAWSMTPHASRDAQDSFDSPAGIHVSDEIGFMQQPCLTASQNLVTFRFSEYDDVGYINSTKEPKEALCPQGKNPYDLILYDGPADMPFLEEEEGSHLGRQVEEVEEEDSDNLWMMQRSNVSIGAGTCSNHDLFQALDRLADIQAGISICSHGLAGDGVGSRFFMIETANIIDLHRSLRIQWPEFADAQGFIFFVHPQPHDTLRPSWSSCVHIIVEFLAKGEMRPPDAVPVLEESIAWDSYGMADIQHAAIYHQRIIHCNDVLSRYTHLCTRARFRCHVRTEGFRIQLEEASTISEGSLIQIHAIPQVLAAPIEFADYIWHGQQFIEASAIVLGAQTLPLITWRFHLILEDGYQGFHDYSPHTSELCGIESVADNVYRLWQELTPGALSYAGSERGRSMVFHFLAFPLETELLPSLIWWADQGGTTVTACWLPPVCTVGAICELLEFRAGQIDSFTAESDGIQQIVTDRFKPRVGRMIWLRPADHLEEDDEIELMQQPRPTVSPNLVPVRFLGTHSTSVQVNIRNDESIMQQLRDDWPLMGRIAADLYALHLVSSPPTFVTAPPAEVYLLQFHADASDQIHPDDVLILLTVSFSAPHSIVNNKQRIRVVWGPKKTTRDQFLSYVRMQRHCASATVLCVLFHNNSPWAIQDSSLRNLRDGDHLRLQIRSDKEGWCDFEYSEESARRMRVFTDSPPADRSEASEHDESLSPYSVRSRSRERSRSSADVHRGPQSPADFEDDQIEEADSDSLLQITSRAFRLTDPTSLTVANPHVIDLWCEKWLEVEVEPVLGPGPDLLGINSFELVIEARRNTDGDGQSKSKLGIQMEHLYVLITAIGIVCYRVYLDCCRTASTSLVKVQGVRHVQRRRLQRDIRFGVYFLVALLICQHCVEAQCLIVHGSETLWQKKDNYENVDIWTSTFARLPPPGNGAAVTEQASRNALSACDDFSEAPSVTLRDATQCCESEPRRIDVPPRVTISLYELLNGKGDSMDLNDLVAFDLHENTRACIDQ